MKPVISQRVSGNIGQQNKRAKVKNRKIQIVTIRTRVCHLKSKHAKKHGKQSQIDQRSKNFLLKSKCCSGKIFHSSIKAVWKHKPTNGGRVALERQAGKTIDPAEIRTTDLRIP